MFCIESLSRKDKNIYWIDIPSSRKDAPIIIFSHGFPDNSFGWEKQINFFHRIFNDKYYIIAPFMHGTLNKENTKLKRIHTNELLKDIEAILKKIDPSNLNPIYLIGHDLGAFLSVAIHDIMPTRINGIVHLNGMGLQQYTHRKFSIRQWLKSYYVILVQLAPIRFIIKNLFPNQLLNIIYKLGKVKQDDPLFNVNKDLFNNLTQYKMIFKRVFYYMGMKISKIKAPTLFIWGHNDIFLNNPTLREVEKFYENAEIRIIEGGHWVQSSSSDHVNTLLKNAFSEWQGQKLE